jgi:hypothetical protein
MRFSDRLAKAEWARCIARAIRGSIARWRSKSCPRIGSPTRSGGFVTEAKAASALNHPHIVTIHEFASADGIEFLIENFK